MLLTKTKQFAAVEAWNFVLNKPALNLQVAVVVQVSKKLLYQSFSEESFWMLKAIH